MAVSGYTASCRTSNTLLLDQVAQGHLERAAELDHHMVVRQAPLDFMNTNTKTTHIT